MAEDYTRNGGDGIQDLAPDPHPPRFARHPPELVEGPAVRERGLHLLINPCSQSAKLSDGGQHSVVEFPPDVSELARIAGGRCSEVTGAGQK